MTDTKLTRIGIFYDGGYFAHVSDYYLYHHERRARISIHGLHALIRDEVGRAEQSDSRYCQIVEAHYFRGRHSAEQAQRYDTEHQLREGTKLFRDRKFEDALIKAGVTPHFLPLYSGDDGRPLREKGVDVWLALEAFDLARSKGLNVVVLVTGDGDYVPLVRKLNGLGTRVLVTAWDLEGDERFGTTRTARTLIDEVTYPVMMASIIDDRSRAQDLLIRDLFVARPPQPAYAPAAPIPPPASPSEANGPPQPGAAALGAAPSALGEAADPRPWRTASRPPGMEESEPMREQGYIANLPYGREFGFIESDFGGERMFFHQSWVEGCSFNDLQPGDRVEFTPDTNPRDGRPTAVRVVRQTPPADAAPENPPAEEE